MPGDMRLNRSWKLFDRCRATGKGEIMDQRILCIKCGYLVRPEHFDHCKPTKLKHMPATPMSQEEMQTQCDFVSEAADSDPGEAGEEPHLSQEEKLVKYHAGEYRFEVPPVYCGNWDDESWVKWIDTCKGWL